MKITNYTIISHDKLTTLTETVRRYIADGWIPQGGICVIESATRYIYFQAMIKQEE